MKALVVRIWQQLLHDKRSLAIMLLAPPVIMSLFYVLLGTSNYEPRIGYYDVPPMLEPQLSIVADAISVTNADERTKLLLDGQYDAVVYLEDEELHIAVLETNSKTGKAIRAIQNTFTDASPIKIVTESMYGSPDDSFFESMAYVFLAFVVFMFTFVVSGMAIVGERTTHTFERMLMTPIRRWQIVAGYLLGYGAFAVLQSIIVMLTAKYLLHVSIMGSFWLCLVVLILLAMCAVALGTTISSFANSEFQVMQFIPLLILPQIFFTGIIPFELIPYNLDKLCYIMPIYYACTPLKDIMVQGVGFADVWPWILAEMVVLAIFFFTNTFSLRRYRWL